MPQSIQMVSNRVSKVFSETVAAVALSRTATLPPVGTPYRKTKRIHGGTQVRVLRGFSDGLESQETVSDLRDFLSIHIRINGRRPSSAEILVFDQNNKTLHGRRGIK